MTYYHYPLEEGQIDTLQMKSSYLWLIIEQLVFIGTLVSNMMFIAIRSCVRHKLNLNMIEERKQLPNIDTIIAISEVANAWNAQFVPWAVNNFLSFSPTTRNEKGDLAVQLQIILASNYLSLAAIGFMVFVPWKKGPEWYLKVSPYIYKTMIYLNYVILPGLNFALFLYYTCDPRYDLKVFPLESWIVFFTIICFTRLTEFFFSLKKIIMDDARIYIETRKLKAQGQIQPKDPLEGELSQEDQIRNQALTDLINDESSYLSRTRTYGEGEVRVGLTLNLNDDIYSIGFISQIRDDVMKRFLDITTGHANESEEEHKAHTLVELTDHQDI
jgi:hypothetical protein